MRQHTEMAERPNDYDVTIEGAKAIITFYTDIEEHTRTEQEGDKVYYTATAWTMTVPAQSTLGKRVAAHPDLWMAKVKAVTEAEEADAALKELEATATDDAVCDLADLAAVHDDAIAELAAMIAELQEG